MFTAPIGLVVDTARAITSDEYNPGFFGVSGPAMDRFFQGVGQVGHSTGITGGLSVLGGTAPGEALKSFWREAELLYNTEYQITENRLPWGLGALQQSGILPDQSLLQNAQPGDVSLQRVGALMQNVSPAAIARHPENVGAFTGQNPDRMQELWRRSEKQTPGQALYEVGLTNFYALPPSLQDEVKASAHYNMFTGTADAVVRWYASPDVLLGKGLKQFRQTKFIFDAEKNLVRATKTLTGDGLRALRTGEGIDGFRSIVLGADDVPIVPGERTMPTDFLLSEGAHSPRGLEQARTGVGGSVAGAHIHEYGPNGEMTQYGSKVTRSQFVRDVEERGILDPIEVAITPSGKMTITDGHHRLDAAIEAGIENVPVKIIRWGKEVPNSRGVDISEFLNPKFKIKPKKLIPGTDVPAGKGWGPGSKSFSPEEVFKASPWASKRVHSVVRSSQLEQLVDEGSLKLRKGMDDVLDEDEFVDLADDVDLDFEGPEFAAVGEELGANPGGTLEEMLYKGLDPEGNMNSGDVIARMEEILAGVDDGNPQAVKDLMASLKAGGSSDALITMISAQLKKTGQSAALSRANGIAAKQGALGDAAERLGRPPRYAGTQTRPMVLFGSEAEARSYAAALYRADPTDMPVMLNTKAKGLEAVHEQYDLPLAEANGEAAFFTTAEKLNDHDVKIHRLQAAELDPSNGVGLEPSKTLPQRLYNQDGSPIEPDQVIGFDDMRLDFEGAMGMNSVEAQKFLEARNMQRAQKGGESFYDIAMSNKIVHQVLNKIGEMESVDDIRRVFFANHPLGQRIAIDLFDAEDYAQRRTVLAAYMGYRLPEVDALPGILKAKIDILHRELAAVQAGRRPNEEYLALIGEPGRFTDMAPETMINQFEEMVSEMADQEAFGKFLQHAADMAPIQQLAMPYTKLAGNAFRKTSFYQEWPLARPIRVTAEMKPHRYMNVRDGMSDLQLERQMKEASKLGVTGGETAAYRERYMRATTDREKIKIVEEAEDLIITKAAAIAKLSKAELLDVIAHAKGGREKVQAFLTSRRYATPDRDMVKYFDETTGEYRVDIVPLLETQTQAYIPLADVKAIYAAATKMGRLRSRLGPGVSIGLDSFYQIWKPTVLLRGGWMLRVVSDEQLRILAKTGSLLKHLAAIETGGAPKFSGLGNWKTLTGGQKAAELYSTATLTQPITWASYQMARAVTKGAEKLGLHDPGYLSKIRGMETERLVSARASFGGPNESMLHEFHAIFGREEATIMNHLRTTATGQWHSVVRDSKEFAPAWQRVLTRQFGESSIGRKVTQDIYSMTKGGKELTEEGYNEVVRRFKRFLRDDRDGRAVAAEIHERAHNPERWADDLIETLKDYTAGFDDTMMEGVLNKKVTREMMEAIPENMRPDVVHAEIVDQALGSSPVSQFMRDFVSGTFDLMGRLPTDTLSRQPLFKQLYGLEMQRVGRLNAAQGIAMTEDTVQAASKAARAFAIQETKTLLYDLAEVSRLGDMMRFVTPFYAAWQEVIKVWTSLAIQDPAVIARGRILWNAPNMAGLVYKDEDTGEEFLQFRLSEKMADKLNLPTEGRNSWARYLATGGVRVSKTSFNMVLNNPLPGAGPLIQVAANNVVKRKPELEASLKFLLPLGVSQDSISILYAPLVRQLKGEFMGPESDDSYKKAFADSLTWQDLMYRTGERTLPPSLDEAHDMASKMWTLRLASRLTAPAQPIFDSPLKPYIDAYRSMMDELGPDTADEAFLNEYGLEFMAVTLGRTVSATGIPPTAEAEVARREQEDLIVEMERRSPEESWGRLILGDSALGEFSGGAYAAQKERRTDPDNPMSPLERTPRPTILDPRTGTIQDADERIGWSEYIKVADQIELKRIEMGLPNLRVKEAEGLAQLRGQLVAALEEKYPAWADDFHRRDDLKWTRRMSDLRYMVTKDSFDERADINGLRYYLEQRDLFIAELNRRKQMGGASTMIAQSNQDLANLWATTISQLLQDNIAFGPLYYRYLEGDTLELKSGG